MTSQQFELSRRRLMQAVGLGAGAVATTSVLGACQAKGSEGEGASGKFVFVYPFDITVETYNAALNTGRAADRLGRRGAVHPPFGDPRTGRPRSGSRSWRSPSRWTARRW